MEYKIANKVEKLIAQFDREYTVPLSSQDRRTLDPRDLTINSRMWTNLFAVESIADIGMSKKLGIPEPGDGICNTAGTGGTLFEARVRLAVYDQREGFSIRACV